MSNDFICYRFPSRELFRTLAAAEGLISEAGELITASHNHAIVELGALTKGGTYDEEGNTIEPPITLPGWHVNTAGFAPPAWDAHLIVVNSACNIFLGGPDRAPDDDTLEEMVQP
jgi:hypothetical protein